MKHTMNVRVDGVRRREGTFFDVALANAGKEGDGKVSISGVYKATAEKFAAAFAANEKVRITFETGEPAMTACSACSEKIDAGDEYFREGDKGFFHKRCLHLPPLVNGRPSCCERAATSSALNHAAGDTRWSVLGNGDVDADEHEVNFCPFCGAKLPEVPQ